MSQQKQSKKWPELGIITKNVKKDKNGNEVKDAQGNPVTVLGFKLADNVTILVDGQPVATSRYGVMQTPMEEVEGLYKSGAIGDDTIEQRKEKAKEVYSWLRYKIQLPPPRATQK
jgi:hypothetical protein